MSGCFNCQEEGYAPVVTTQQSLPVVASSPPLRPSRWLALAARYKRQAGASPVKQRGLGWPQGTQRTGLGGCPGPDYGS